MNFPKNMLQRFEQEFYSRTFHLIENCVKIDLLKCFLYFVSFGKLYHNVMTNGKQKKNEN